MAKILVDEQLLIDARNGMEWALRDIPDECNCDAYMENDTGAWIHNEETCQMFTRYHLEATCCDLEDILASAPRKETSFFHGVLDWIKSWKK